MATVQELCSQLAELKTEVVCVKADPTFMQTQIAKAETVSSDGVWMLMGIVLLVYVLKHFRPVQELVFTYYDNLKALVTKHKDYPDEVTDNDVSFGWIYAISGLGGSVLVGLIVVAMAMLLA